MLAAASNFSGTGETTSTAEFDDNLQNADWAQDSANDATWPPVADWLIGAVAANACHVACNRMRR
jgi:hypothetical protein